MSDRGRSWEKEGMGKELTKTPKTSRWSKQVYRDKPRAEEGAKKGKGRDKESDGEAGGGVVKPNSMLRTTETIFDSESRWGINAALSCRVPPDQLLRAGPFFLQTCSLPK